MPDQIYIGNISKGQKSDRIAFNIDNDAFPNMFNFYTWRGRAKRKRGTKPLAQLELQVQSVLTATPPLSWQVGTIVTLNGAGAGTVNLISRYGLPATSTITPASISFSDGVNTYTEPATPNGTLVGAPGGSGTINYATGAVTITGGAANGNLIGFFDYFPGQPVVGLEDYDTTTAATSTNNPLFPVLLAFDTTNAYQIAQISASNNYFYNVSYYKSSNVPVEWSGQNYQQFWSTNYSGAFWATNNKPGLNFLNATKVSGSGGGGSPFVITFTSIGSPFTTLVVGDQLFFNQSSNGGTIVGTVGTVTAINNASTGTYTVTFTPPVTWPGAGTTAIALMLTNSLTGQDGIRWYDGDMTSGTGLPTSTTTGWVNFSPPLTASTVSIDNTPAATYYLVGALAILPYKDRLLFFSPYIQAITNGSAGTIFQLTDTVLWSWNGTPYYNSLTPSGETYNISSYYVDQTGFGGYLPAGIPQPIISVSNNQDVLLIGFGGDGRKTRFVYTGDDLQPFLFFNINSELPSSSTFSAVALDKGMLDIGSRGIAITDQQSCSRIDLDIPDNVFQIQNTNFGLLRVNALRDYKNEWIYFTYPLNNSPWVFPTQTFLLNYRDNTWGILYENWTHQGTYRSQISKTWSTTRFKSWLAWNEPWNAGSTSPLFPQTIAGNPQGYVLITGEGTNEAPSGTIQAIANSGGLTQITSTNHCVSANNPSLTGGDYLYFTGSLGVTGLNGLIGRVVSTANANTFVVDIPFPSGSYLGLGTYTRLSQPLVQTKQFPFYWDQGRKVRLATQRYLLDQTPNGQVTVNIYLSQDSDTVYNAGSIVPSQSPDPINNALIYSQLMYTCPESTNLGLTPANINLQMVTAKTQGQIWHRFNTSLIGDSVQIGITMNDSQMRTLAYATSEIVLHGMHLTVSPSQVLA
jgi:hypothetical protein